MCTSVENYTLSTAHRLEFQPFIVFELLYNSVNGRSLINSVCLVDGTPYPLMEKPVLPPRAHSFHCS